jgi:hypothetical protein
MKKLTFVLIFISIYVSATTPKDNYLSNFDLVWNRLPLNWTEGAFTGNGKVGTMIWGNSSKSLRFDIGNTELYNGKSRAPIGKLVLKLNDDILEFDMKLHLQNALVVANLKTVNGSAYIKTFTERTTDLQRIKYSVKGKESIKFDFELLPPLRSDVLWKSVKKEIGKLESPDFTNPLVVEKVKNHPQALKLKPILEGKEGSVFYKQVFINKNTGYVLLWTDNKLNKKEGEFIYTTSFFKDEDAESFLESSLEKFRKEIKIPWDKSFTTHVEWWKNYYNKALISIPDKRLEANYWIQNYKIGSALKKDGMPLDLLGPWFRATPWPRIWANLNVQITYPIMNQLGCYNQANTLFRYIDNNNQHFIDAVPKKYRDNGASMGRGFSVYTGTSFSSEYGNFLWLLYNYSQFLDYFPDDKRRVEKYYPLLKRGINFVIENLKKDENGVYHFPEDISPEYFVIDEQKNKQFKFEDTNYNIGLLNWALKEALAIAKESSDNGRDIKKYKNVLQNLVPYQIDSKEGLMVAKDIRMSLMHRHFSHLIAYYPLAELNVDNSKDLTLIDKSVDQWLSRPKFGWGYKGYTYTASCAMYARMGQGDKALLEINKYLNQFCSPNTFYVETGPVIETPMHSASVTLELLLQSFSTNSLYDELRVFTGVPSRWKNASFYKLNTEGGHLVSGVLKNGVVEKVQIEVGKTSEIKLFFPKNIVKNYSSKKGAKLQWSTQGEYNILQGNVVNGDVIIIGVSSDEIQFEVSEKGEYHYGLNS